MQAPHVGLPPRFTWSPPECLQHWYDLGQCKKMWVCSLIFPHPLQCNSEVLLCLANERGVINILILVFHSNCLTLGLLVNLWQPRHVFSHISTVTITSISYYHFCFVPIVFFVMVSWSRLYRWAISLFFITLSITDMNIFSKLDGSLHTCFSHNHCLCFQQYSL